MNLTSPLVFILIGWGMVSTQAQNPFDIKSRNLMDTTRQVQSDSPVVQLTPTRSATPKTDGPEIPSTKNTELFDSPKTSNVTDSEEETGDTLPITSGDTVGSTVQSEATDAPTLSDTVSGLLTRGNTDQDVHWWYYVFDLVLLLFLLGAFLYDKKIFPPIRKAFVHENFLRFLYRDTYLRKPGTFIYLNILFLLNLGFILYRTAQYMERASTFRDYMIIQGVVILLFAVKHLALHALSRLVDKPFEVLFYQYWMILSAGLMGLWLVPVTLMISVIPVRFLFITLVISCIPITLLLIYRQVKAMIQAKFFLYKHFFHFFLYFCAVEIVPVVLLADILVQN